MIVTHATILVGIPFNEQVEQILEEKYGPEYENDLLFKNDIHILPYDRCPDCEALIGMMISDLDDSGDEFYEEIAENDIVEITKEFETFLKKIDIIQTIKLYNVLHVN